MDHQPHRRHRPTVDPASVLVRRVHGFPSKEDLLLQVLVM